MAPNLEDTAVHFHAAVGTPAMSNVASSIESRNGHVPHWLAPLTDWSRPDKQLASNVEFLQILPMEASLPQERKGDLLSKLWG